MSDLLVASRPLMGDDHLSERVFAWEHVARGVDPDDVDFVTDYALDLTGRTPAELGWRYGTFLVPPLRTQDVDPDRRPLGHVEALRPAVAAGKTPPVVVVGDAVVDGWHRLRAAAANGQRTVEAWFATTHLAD